MTIDKNHVVALQYTLNQIEENGEKTFVEQTNEEPETVVEKGILIFHDDKGDLRFKQIGEVSIENITYYRRYLDQLEKGLWEQRIGGIENA